MSVLEGNELVNAGLGSSLTRDGTVECDAGFMESLAGHRQPVVCFGGVAAAQGLCFPGAVAAHLALSSIQVGIRETHCFRFDNPANSVSYRWVWCLQHSLRGLE